MKELFNEENRTEEDNRNSSNASKSKTLNHIEENKEYHSKEKEDNWDTFLTNIDNRRMSKEVKEESIVEKETNDKRPDDMNPVNNNVIWIIIFFYINKNKLCLFNIIHHPQTN